MVTVLGIVMAWLVFDKCLQRAFETKISEDRAVYRAYMANIYQEQISIRNMQVVSSNRVHSTHPCEANKCRIFKLFFLFIR